MGTDSLFYTVVILARVTMVSINVDYVIRFMTSSLSLLQPKHPDSKKEWPRTKKGLDKKGNQNGWARPV